MMKTTASATQRRVSYTSLDDFRAEAERAAATHSATVGNWTLGQILLHLSRAINASFDGFGYVAPWPVRRLVGPLLKNRLLYQRMKPGLKLPRKAADLLPPAGTDLQEGLESLRAALARFDNETPHAEHPLLGRLTPEEWVSLHLRHAELHMSFVRLS